MLVVPQLAASQQADSIVPGSRMRVTETSADKPMRYVGRLLTVTKDSLSLADAQGTVTSFATARLTRVEVSTAQRTNVMSGLGIGLIAGASSGALAGAFAAGGRNELTFIAVIVLGTYGGAVGAVAGGAIGAFVRTDVWETVHDSRWRVGVRTGNDRGLSLRWSF